MTGPAGPPPDVLALARRRADARAARDFAAADLLRAEIERLGWLVRDTPAGPRLELRPPYAVLGSARELPDRSALPDARRASVAVLAEGWPDDVRRCLRAVLAHVPADVGVLVLDVGDVAGAGEAVHEVATAHGDRVEAWHVAGPVGWGEARGALLRADRATVHVWLDPSVELTGDAVTPLLAALADPGVAVAGGWGVAADPDWHAFHDVPGPADVDAVLGYLLAVRRADALAAGGVEPRARFYRNADLEFSLALRERGGRAVAVAAPPAVRHRHRGYHDSDPAYRDRESRRNYDRLLARFGRRRHRRGR